MNSTHISLALSGALAAIGVASQKDIFSENPGLALRASAVCLVFSILSYIHNHWLPAPRVSTSQQSCRSLCGRAIQPPRE